MKDEPIGYIDGFPIRRCMRSGACCKVATCALGVQAGAPQEGCTFLKGDKPGAYSCGLIEERPELREALAIGEGCCMPMFNTEREKLVRAL